MGVGQCATGGGEQRPSVGAERVHVVLSRRAALAVLIGAVVSPSILVVLLASPYSPFLSVRNKAQGTTAIEGPVSTKTSLGSTGPWGQLEYTEITISPPFEMVESCEPDAIGNDWHFRDFDRWGLIAFLEEVDLTADQRQTILAAIKPDAQYDGIVVQYSDKLAESLSLDARAKIYDWLSEYPENLDQDNAYRFRGDSPAEWFKGAQLPAELIERVKRFVYRHGRYLMFADLSLVLPHAKDELQRNMLLKRLSREKTLLIKLRITEESDIEKLANYWGRGGRGKDVGPLLESLAEFSGSKTIDIAHLLPRFARGRLYTYPTPSNFASVTLGRNCHWTAANFFNDTPDDRYLDIEEYRALLRDNYYRIFGKPSLGDLVLFTDEAGKLFHSAVYIADNIIYTKNGNRFSRPWMFLDIDSMKDFYPRKSKINVMLFRRSTW